MNPTMQRRRFLKATVCTFAVSSGIGAAAEAVERATEADPWKRIGCTTVSFRSRFPATRTDKTPTANDLTALAVPQLFADQLGIHNVELWSQHFADTSLDYCRSLKEAAAAVGSKIVNIQLDDPGYNLSHIDATERDQSVAFVKAWMDRAAACGAPSLRANTGNGKAPFDLRNTGNAYRQLAAYGRQIGVKVLIENHGGYSSDPDHVVALVEYVDSPFCRSLPDFGNMPAAFSAEQRADFLKKLLPFAELISVKGMVFDEQYEHLTYDVGACVRLAESCGFRGIYSVELWDRNYQPADPARAVKQIMQSISSQLS